MKIKKPNPIDVFVGARIRLRRNMLNLSQEKLGDALGVTFQQVQKYEKGTNRVSASRLQNISKILDVTVDFFFDGVPEENGLETAATTTFDKTLKEYLEFTTTSDGIKLNRAFLQITNVHVRAKALALIRALAEIEEN
ncbi:helix-turn-helix domain-containing protein [Lentilitoribacter sp. EG35]|uniref:helix-turn-helix domain-containing protein n=1 Tax=Lentilitoribacter sp. EG35 TaxID=3234192 RepID=UPI00345F3376